MIYDDIVVPIPHKKRVRKTDKAVYEILARKGKNSEKDVVQFVGRAISDTQMHPSEKYFELHPKEPDTRPSEYPAEFCFALNVGGYLLIRKIAEQTGMYAVLNDVFGSGKDIILSWLSYLLLNQRSSAQLYEYFAFNHYTSLNYVPSESALSRLFNKRLSEESIGKFLEKWVHHRLSNHTDGISIDFDSTSFNTASKSLTLSEYGHPKVDEHLPQINVAYFLDRETGVPVYYDIYYGSITDMEHCKTAISKVREISPNADTVFVMDRGYFSESNIRYILNSGYSFLCMGRSNKLFRSLTEEYGIAEICRARNRVVNSIYGIKTKAEIFGDEMHVYLFYNEGGGIAPYNAKHDEIVKACGYLPGKKDKDGHIRTTYGKYADLVLDKDCIITSAEPNWDELDRYKRSLGYFWIVSNEDLTLKEVLTDYRQRDVIEKAFRMSKSDSDLLKKYSQTDSAYNAKTFMGFLSAVIRASLLHDLKSYFFQYGSETTETVLLEMDKIIAQRIQNRYLPKYALTNRQKQILAAYEMDFGDVKELISEINDLLVFDDAKKIPPRDAEDDT